MTEVMCRLAAHAHRGFPITIYYAFKQSESEDETGTTSTGWETFLDAVLRAGLAITGTWPMRTELGNRMIGADTNDWHRASCLFAIHVRRMRSRFLAARLFEN